MVWHIVFMKKKLPEFKTDEEAEAFVDAADLSHARFNSFAGLLFQSVACSAEWCF
jgi:hypothetical protein